jgi:hypothetical protein
MSEIESTDRRHPDDGTLEGREAYEPPRITSLGTVLELTGGASGGTGDVTGISNASAAKGRGVKLPATPVA